MMPETSVIYIGKKPVYNYAVAGLMKLNDGMSHLSIKARGNSIPKAVDVAEFIRNRFMPQVRVQHITIDTEALASQYGGVRNVSTIEITLAKPEPVRSEAQTEEETTPAKASRPRRKNGSTKRAKRSAHPG